MFDFCGRSRRGAQAALSHSLQVISTARQALTPSDPSLLPTHSLFCLLNFFRSKLVELRADVVASAPPKELPDLSGKSASAARNSVDEYDPDICDEYDPDVECGPAVPERPPPPASPPSSKLSLHPRIHVVDSSASAAAAMSALEQHDIFAVDLEGVELGRGGTIAILQVRAHSHACCVGVTRAH